MDLPDEEEEWSVLTLPKVQEPSGKRDKLESSMPMVRWRKGVLLISPRWGNTETLSEELAGEVDKMVKVIKG